MRDQPTTTEDPARQHAQAAEAMAQAMEDMREAIREEQEAAAARLQFLGSVLQRKADERVGLRSEIEQRWLRSIRQLNGKYESSDLPNNGDKDAYGSKVYVPLTRRLRNMAVARTVDVLFPSDDRFWVLEPSPKAEMADLADMVGKLPPDTPVLAPGMKPGTMAKDVASAVQEMQADAEMRAARMERQIDDRLAEGRYAAKARRALEDAIDLGTGVLKGPVNELRTRRAWVPGPDGQMALEVRKDVVPTVEYVDLWNFYPDLSSADIRDCADVLEAHPMLRGDLMALRDQPGFLAAAIDQVCSSDPRPDNQTRRQDLRDLAGLSGAKDDRYIVWEFNGPIRGADLNACCRYEYLAKAQGDTELGAHEGVEEAPPYEDPYDDEEDYYCTVWFVDGVVIKAVERPLNSEQRHIYSVVYWQRDKSSIFGFGLPDEVRDQQTSANSSFRAMMDNMGLTVGPQIVFDEDAIEPVDGKAEIRPFKLWRKKTSGAPVRDVFGFYQIESRLNELGAVFDRSKQLMDEVATLPAFVSGAEQPNMQSATQATLTYNSSSLWVRRMVRHWDDDMAEPTLSRMVEWEMDHNPDASIKGDFKPIARGATALIELEGQGQRMVQFIQLASSMGVPAKDQMRMLRQFARSLKLDPDEMLPTEEQIQQMREEPQEDPEMARVRMMEAQSQRVHEAKMAQVSIKGAELESRADDMARRERLALLEMASRERMTLQQIAERHNIDLANLEREILENEAQRRHEAQMQNAETAVKMRMGSGL